METEWIEVLVNLFFFLIPDNQTTSYVDSREVKTHQRIPQTK